MAMSIDFLAFLRTLAVSPQTVDDIAAAVTIAYPPYRNISATDVDRFIQLPVTIFVDATDTTLVTEEDVLRHYDPLPRQDYAIYAQIPKNDFFQSGSDWCYGVTQNKEGRFELTDGGASPISTPTSQWVIDPNMLSTSLSAGAECRFVHYRQAFSFFKYSFPVGDPWSTLSGPTSGQTWAVYLDVDSGVPQPYLISTGGRTQLEAEDKTFVFAPVPVGLVPTPRIFDSGIGANVVLDCICPPDPDFIALGPLALRTDSVTGYPTTIRNRPGGTAYTPSNFAMLGLSPIVPNNYGIFVYCVIQPPSDSPHLGDSMYALYRSHPGPPPQRDSDDAHPSDPGTSYFQVAAIHPGTPHTPPNLDPPYQNENPAPRFQFPVSSFTVTSDGERMVLPFQYDACNLTDLGDPRKLCMGGRVLQLVSEYLFDAAGNEEMSFFPYLLEESASLTKKISLELARTMQASADVRSQVLRQILVKYGRRYFDEWKAANSPDTNLHLKVSEVIDRLDELFVFFVATVATTVSNRAKDRVESLHLMEIPIAIRLF
jgi:hypothetical protein